MLSLSLGTAIASVNGRIVHSAPFQLVNILKNTHNRHSTAHSSRHDSNGLEQDCNDSSALTMESCILALSHPYVAFLCVFKDWPHVRLLCFRRYCGVCDNDMQLYISYTYVYQPRLYRAYLIML